MQVYSAISATDGLLPVGQRDRASGDGSRAAKLFGALPRDWVTVSGEALALSGAGKTLTPAEQQEVAALKAKDARVRQQASAHQSAGGSSTGSANYRYQVGPDDRSYAVSGEVPINLQAGRTPDETIANARQARRAALASSDPSGQDLAVAAQASQMEVAAQARKSRLATAAYGRQVGKNATDPTSPLKVATPLRYRAAQGGGLGMGATSSPDDDLTSEATYQPIQTLLTA